MKEIAKICCMIFLVASMSSCSKFLDTEPQDFLVKESFYETEEQLNFALAATYSPLGEQSLFGGRIVRIGMDADDGFYDRSTDIYGASSYNVATADPDVKNWWSTCYKGINRANLLLANIQKPTMDETARKVVEGEARFLRGFYYFLLVSNFGDVPLLLTPTENLESTAVPRTPIKDVYAQIIADLEFAEANVKTAQVLGFGGRANKSAARGLLARVNLFMAGFPLKDESRYPEAHKWAKMIIDDAGHQLNPDYKQVFINLAADYYDAKETIFEIELYGNTQEVYREAGAIGVWAGITFNTDTYKDPTQGFGYGFLNATGVLWEKYANPTSLYSYDLRRDFAIASFTLSGNPAVERARPITEIYQRDAGKYRRVYERVLPKEKNYSPINYPILRYADVLLMFAEADNFINSGPTPEAIEAVNQVRRRGYGKYLNGIGQVAESIKTIRLDNGGANYTSTPVVTISGGGGVGATATATRSTANRITAITLTNPGSKFTDMGNIIVSITGGGGTGALASVTALTSATEADLQPADVSSELAFLTTIQHERSRELCFEGLRKGDLVRWGLLVKNMKIVYNHILEANLPSSLNYAQWSYLNVSDRDVVWPIPAREMGLNSALIQNRGW